MIDGIVLDTTALIDFASGKSLYIRARVRAAIADFSTVVVPAAALSAAWRDAPDHAHPALERVPTLENVFYVDELDEVIARQAGRLCAGSELGVDEIHAAWSASWRQWPLLTTTGERYARIPRLHIEQLP
ncbi:hypothetical protein [Nocardia sp. NPDC052566]|uniref:hypothetical protein n=1 Tax=Nocardia sp. NPDC052566 TaxID=3364330 RepID=UPI0037C689BF